MIVDGSRFANALVRVTSKKVHRPLVVTLAGGYAASPARTAQLHAIVFEEALRSG